MAGRFRLPSLLAAVLVLGVPLAFTPKAAAQSPAAAAGVSASADQDMPDAPIPAEAGQGYSPIGEGFAVPATPRAGLFGGSDKERSSTVAKTTPGMAPFFRDTEIDANSRSYWLNLHGFDGRDYEALTSGGYLSYQSGFAADLLQLNAVIYTTQPIYAPKGAGRTLNLTPDGDQITTLGQANVRLKLAGQQFTAGRQLVRTAFLNPKDNRMIPLAFEGIVLVPEPDAHRSVDYIASYLTRWKPQVSDDFISFARPFGVKRDEGMLITGLRHRGGDLNFGAVNYWINDTLNTAYGEIDYLLPFGKGNDDALHYRVSINDLDQRTVGADLMPGAPYRTYQASARFITSYRGFVLTSAASTVGEGGIILDPFGNIPAFTSLHQSAFERAGEEAWMLTLSYDFTRFGVEGLRMLVGYGEGEDAIDPRTQVKLPDREVLNLRLEYEPQSGPLKGLQVYLYYASQRLIDANQIPNDDQTQFRAVVNYLVPLP